MNKRIINAVAVAAAMLAAAAALKYAQNAQMLDADTTRRAMQVLIGLMLAAYANVMPKDIGRLRSSPRAQARAQMALRVGGWALTLAGLAYAGLWAFAPLAFADTASMVVVLAGVAITLGYAFWCLASCRGASSAPLA